MKTKIIVFEDYFMKNFFPLTYTRPVFDLKIGTNSNFQRLHNLYGGREIGMYTRSQLRDLLFEKYATEINQFPEDYDRYLFINGRVITNDPIHITGDEEIGVQGDTVSYIRINKENFNTNTDFLSSDFREKLSSKLKTVRTDFTEIKYYWDIIRINSDFILRDFNKFYKSRKKSDSDKACLVKEDFISIEENVKLAPNCIIDASKGQVIIKKDSLIGAQAYIEGPAFIGERCEIKPQARIEAGSSIHYRCKVGGEVSNSIFHSFSNKAHHGFIGHSYIGKWVNIGAGTSNSNLKNNYSYINVILNGKHKVKTDMQFLGSLIGDCSKLSINCSLNSGSIIGFCCNIFQSGRILPKFISSFSWGLSDIYKLEKAKKDIAKTMERREINFTPHFEKLFEHIYCNR